MTKSRPLKGKRRYLGPGNLPDYWLYKHRDVKSAVEWLMSRKLGTTAKAFDFEGNQYYVFKADDFNEAFHDVIKED